jgi:serine/threonine-protein kinase
VGQNEEAVALFGRTIEGSRRVLGPDHYRLAFSLQQSTLPLRELERYEEADDAAREALAIFLALAADHPEATNVLNGLATSDMARHDFAAAEDKYRRAMTEWTATRGPEHRSTLQARANLGRALASRGRWEDAEPLAREALAARERIFGAESAFTAHSRWVLGEVLLAAGRPAAAAAEHERARAIAAAVFGEAHNLTVRAGIGIAFGHLELIEAGGDGSLAAVEAALARAEAGQRALDPEHSRLAEIDLIRARLALAEGRAQDAVELAVAARRRFAARLGEGAPAAAEAERWREAAQRAAAGGPRHTS